MKYFKKLIGERIYLSPRNNEDIEQFTEWLNDFETTDYIGRSAYITTLEGEKQYFEENLNKDYNFFIITLKEDKLIGTVGLENYDSINRTATLGIFIGDKDYRNEGYGTEANIEIDEFITSTYATTFDDRYNKEQTWIYIVYKGSLKKEN